jgi:PKD repeat protein
MPSPHLGLVLTATEGTLTAGSLTGYIDAAHGLHYPVVEEATGRGPAVSGSWSGESFYLQSEPFTTVMTTGVILTRQVVLHSGVISDSGQILTGVYSETLSGLTPAPMEIVGTFELFWSSALLEPAARFSAFPVTGPPPLTVQFTDLSGNDPIAWAWDLGDGAASIEQHPSHTYTELGTYTVTLTVVNAHGTDTLTKTNFIQLRANWIYLPIVLKSH